MINKPMHYNKIIDFIRTNNKHYSTKELRKLYRKDISRFIDLLDDAVKVAGEVPEVAVPFYKEISQLNKLTQTKEAIMNNRNQSNQENSTPKTERKTIRFIIVEKVVSTYNRIKSFLSGNIGKVKAIGATIVTVAIAYLARAHSGMFLALAALKSSGAITGAQSLGMTMLSNAVEIKDAVIKGTLSAVSWIKGLFTSNDSTVANAA
jgi:hypothetical protein